MWGFCSSRIELPGSLVITIKQKCDGRYRRCVDKYWERIMSQIVLMLGYPSSDMMLVPVLTATFSSVYFQKQLAAVRTVMLLIRLPEQNRPPYTTKTWYGTSNMLGAYLRCTSLPVLRFGGFSSWGRKRYDVTGIESRKHLTLQKGVWIKKYNVNQDDDGTIF